MSETETAATARRNSTLVRLVAHLRYVAQMYMNLARLVTP
jgi:hypothetical protein